MKNRFLSTRGFATLVMFVSGPVAHSTALYWDINGTTANTAVAVTGAWNGTNAFWNTAATGTGGAAQAGTTAADDLIFSSGTNLTTGTITASGTRLASSITFEDNIIITLAGPVTLGGTGTKSGIFVNSTKSNATTVSGLVTLATAASIQTGSGAVTNSGGIDLGANALSIDIAGAGRISITGVITGTGAVTVSGSSTGDYDASAAGAHTYSGGATLNPGAIVAVGSTSAGPAGSPTSGSFGTGTLTLAGGRMRSGTGASITVGNTVTLAADTTFYTNTTEKSLVFTGPVTITGASRTLTSTVGTTVAGTAAVFNGSIGDGGNGLGLTKAGAGNLTLNGTNTYTGITSIDAGVLSIAATGSLPGWNTNGQFSVAGGATLAVQNGVLDAELNTMLGTTNFAAGSILGFDTVAGNRACALNLTDTAQGTLGLTKIGANTLILSGTNTYSGNTSVNAGSLSIASTASLPGWNVNGRYSLLSGTSLVAQNPVTDSSVSTMLATTNFAAGATLGLDTTAGDRTYATPITNSAQGLLNLAKLGSNTLTLTGANTYTGSTTVSGGTLVAAGASAAAGNIVVGNTTDNAVLNVVSGGTMTGGTITAGTAAGSFGAVNVTGGNLILATPETTDGISFGGGEGGYGAFTMSTGTFNQSRLMFGGTTSTTTLGGVGVGHITGGTVNSTGWFIIARSGASTGIVTITGGTINHANANNTLSLGLQGSGRAELNVAGGLIDNTGRNVTFSGGTGGTFHWTGTGLLNLNAGTLLAPAIFYDTNVGSANASSYVNFSGGTLKASAASTSFLPAFTPTGTGVNRVFVNGPFGGFSGGAVIDTNGFNNTISASLLAPSGNGVTSLNIDSAGSGYIGAPAVRILDDGLPSSATAYAVVGTDSGNASTFGKVTSVVITNPGVIAGTPTVSLVGGGGAGAAVSVASTGPNTSGGLTKTGLGTLTLTGLNTYTGSTSVTGGTLSVTDAGALSNSNGLSVGSGAQFSYLPASPGTLTLGASGTLTLAANSFVGTTFGSTITAPGAASVSGVVNLVLSGPFTAGSPYTVLTASSGLNTATYNVINPTDFTFTQNVTPTSVQITPTAATALANAYWIGGLAGSPAVWAASNGSSSSNWTSDGAGTASPLVPGAAANVVFSDTGAVPANQVNMTLGADMTINSLTCNSTNPVSLLKSGIPVLTIGSTTGSGIAVNSGSGPVTLNADLTVGNAQTWTNNSSTPLTLGGVVNTGANLLTVAGSGSTIFADFYGGTGGLTVSSGTTTITTGNPAATQTWTNDSANPLAVGTLVGTTSALTLAGTGATTISSFIGNGGGLTVANGTTTIASATLAIAQTFTSNSSSNGLSLGSVSNNGYLLTVGGTGISEITGTVSGAGGLAKTGAGTTTLLSSNSYNGLTTVGGGTLNITTANALGSIASGTTQSGTSELRLTGGITTAAEPLTINGGGITNLGALRSFAGDNTYAGTITMAAQSRINADADTLTLGAATAVVSNNFTLVVGGAGNVTIPGDLALGNGGVAKDGAGILTLSGTYSYKGNTSVNGNGTILYTGTNNYTGIGEYLIGSGSTGTFNMTGGTLSIDSTGTNTAGTSGATTLLGMRVGNGNLGNGTLNVSGGTLTVGSTGPNGGEFLVGYSSNAATAAVGTVTVSGSATLNIGDGGGRVFIGGADNTATSGGTGTLTVTNGTVNVGASGAFPNNNLYLSGYRGTGTLNLNGGLLATARPITRGGGTANVNFNGGLLQLTAVTPAIIPTATGLTVNVRDNGAKIDTNGFDTTISQAIVHSTIIDDAVTDGGLTKSGAGTLSLSAANTYNGPTLISEGTLQIGSASAAGSLSIDSTIVTHGTFSVSRTNAVAQGTDFSASPITGTGGFAQSGSGTTTLNAANTFTGPSIMSAGTLSVATIENIGTASPLGAGDGSSASNNTASLVFNGGTLAFTGITGSTNRGFTMNANGTFSFPADNNNSFAFSGNVAGTGQLTLGGLSAVGRQNVLKLSGNNSDFTGNVNVSVGGLRITNSNGLGSGSKAIAMTNGTNGNPNIQLDGSGGDITLPDTFTYTVSNQTFNGCFVNLAGNNTVDGLINITSGGGGLMATSTAGHLTIAADITATQAGRAAFLQGASTGTVSGIISDGASVGTFFVQKTGTGTWALTGPNTYQGATSVGEGTLAVSSINSVTGGSLDSNLGAPVTEANGTIALGNGSVLLATPTTSGILRYTGTGETTDRILNLAGTTGGGAVDQSGTGLLKFTSALTATGAGSKTLTLSGSTAGTGEIAGAIVDNSGSNTTSVEKTGTGTWTLSGANTYSGSTTVTGGTLSLTSAYLADSSSVSVATGSVLKLDYVGTDVVASLTLGGVVKTSGIFDSTNSGGLITGDGKIQVSAGYSSWAGANGIPGEPATGDFDKDGLANLVEYALGLNPTVPNGSPGTFNGSTLSFTKNPLAVANGDVTYQIEQSESLTGWTVVVPLVNDSTTISYTLPTGQPKEFARLKVIQIP